MPLATPIERYMTPAPAAAPRETTVAEARRLLQEHGFHHLPIIADEHLVGIVSDRDLLLVEALLGEVGADLEVGRVMREVPFTCGPAAHLDAVAAEMLKRRCGSAIIVEPDHPTHVLGIFTVTDALRAIAGQRDTAC
jgi:acetoin utilization protein AcuB